MVQSSKPAVAGGGGGSKMVSPKASPWASGAAQVAPKPAVFGGALNPMAKKEEEMKKRQEELKSRRDAEESKRLMHAAAFTVRKVIQRLRVVQPAQFAERIEELEKAQMENLDAMGELGDSVGEEAARAIEVAQKRFKEFEEKEIAEEIAANEKAEKAKEDIERISNIAIEATQEVEEVEAKAAEAVEESALLPDDAGIKEAATQDILDLCTKIEEAIASAKEVYKAALTSLKAKREEVSKARGLKEASQITAQLVGLQKRLTASQPQLVKLPEAIKAAKAKLVVAQAAAKLADERKAAALKKEQDLKEAFSKHDADGDGKLNRKEVTAFAEREYGFALGSEALEKILGKIPGGKDGVGPEKLQQLRSMVSMEKSTAKARQARVEEAERERLRKEKEERLQKERGEKKVVVQETLDTVAEELKSATEIIPRAREAAKPLLPGDEELSASLTTEAVAKTQAEVLAAKTLLDGVEEMLSGLEGQDEEDKILRTFIVTEVTKHKGKVKNLREQLAKLSAQAKEAHARCARKQYAEMEAYRLELVPSVLALMKSEGKTGPELFKASAQTEGSIGAKDFVTLLQSLLEKALRPADSLEKPLLEKLLRPSETGETEAQNLFAHLAVGEQVISEDKYISSMTVIYYRVVKTTVITEAQGLTSKAIRKLEPGDLCQSFEGPVAESDQPSLLRVRCKAISDGEEGWVTLAGNKGSLLLEPVGAYHICVKETTLGDGHPVSAKTVRKVHKGETAQMVDPESKDATCGVMRMKVKMTKDGEIGWVSTANSKTGLKFFEPC